MGATREDPEKINRQKAEEARLGPGTWTWAEPGPGVPCCEAQADGFPCPELRPDCSRCAREILMKEGWSGRLAPWVPLERLV